MKKILFVCGALYGGGSERVVARLANYFDRQGYQVVIAATRTDERYPLNDSIKVENIDGNHLGIIISLRRVSKRVQPDVMIAMGTFFNYCAVLAKINGCKVIGSERSDPEVTGKGFFKRHFRNFMYQHVDTMVFQTPDARALFPERIKCKSEVIPNPLEDNLIEPFTGKRDKRIVNFCRLSPPKNLRLLIDSFEMFCKKKPGYELHIYGEGPERESLEKKVKLSHLEGAVILHHNKKNIHEIIRNAAMFVSSSDYEGLSNSMLEAMALGLPTICTDCPCGGARMMIQDGVNGLLVPIRNKVSLCNAMLRLANDTSLSYSLSCEATKVRSQLSLFKVAKMWEKLFD